MECEAILVIDTGSNAPQHLPFPKVIGMNLNDFTGLHPISSTSVMLVIKRSEPTCS